MGLIVTWAGYIKGVRWTWFVMFVIVSVWAFPLFMLSFVLCWRHVDLLGIFASAIMYSGVCRNFAEIFLEFVLMAVALVLPLKAFISRPGDVAGMSEHASSVAPDKRTSPEI
jgi:ABC-type dipeptide/oligopeptide/nickel transport system permease component